MSRLRLLPGEREEVRLHPAPLGSLGQYLEAAAPALIGSACVALFRSEAWREGPGPPWLPYAAGYVALAAFLVAAGAASALVRPARWPLVVAGAVAAVALATGIGLGNDPALAAAAAAACSIPLLGLAELERRSRTYHLTNLRVVYEGGVFRRRSWSLRYADLTDLDGRQSAWARFAGHGTLLPVSTASQGFAQRIASVRPYRRVRELLELLIRDATATDFLREETGLRQKREAALAAFQRHRP